MILNALAITALVFAPLIYGGNRPLPLLVLELIAVLILIGVALNPKFLKQLSLPFLGLIASMLLLPLLQLIPIPFSIWQMLPAQQAYGDALQIAITQGDPALLQMARPLSLVPDKTQYAFLALLPPIAIFLACIGMTTHQLRALVPVFLLMAALQALIAVAEYGIGRSANGTYVNRDHLAGFLEMALPISLAMLASSLGNSGLHAGFHRTLRDQLRSWIYRYCNRTALYAFISLSVLLGLIFTQSRSGVALAMLIIILCAIAFSMRLGGRNVYGMVGTYSAVGLSLAVLIGLVPVLDRFVMMDHLQDARWTIYLTMQRVISDVLPFGSGVGSFPEVFARYHPEEITGVVVNRAHNDYLEWIMEGGVLAAAIIFGLLTLYVLRWRKLIKGATWNVFHFIQIGAGIGLFAIILHSLVDFNLRIPANQIYFAFIAALFFHNAHADNEKTPHPEVPAPDYSMASTQPLVTKDAVPSIDSPDQSKPDYPQTVNTASKPSTHATKPGPNPFGDA